MTSLLITGATGSLGRALLPTVLERYDRVVVFSRDELKQAELAQDFDHHPRLRFFLGDVRDPERLRDAFFGVTYVLHAAALKRVDAVADNPSEVFKTNIQGSANVVRAALDTGVKKVLMVSSDKAVAPSNVYGVSKAAMEAQAVADNPVTHPRGTRVACVRYGNVLGSRGSVIHVWRRAIEEDRPIPLTSRHMTRFWITLPAAVTFVLTALEMMQGGEIFVPHLPAIWMSDLVKALALGHPVQEIGLRPGGEKLHETLLSEDEQARTINLGWAYCVRPAMHQWIDKFPWQGEPYPVGRAYCSATWPWRLTKDELRKEMA